MVPGSQYVRLHQPDSEYDQTVVLEIVRKWEWWVVITYNKQTSPQAVLLHVLSPAPGHGTHSDQQSLMESPKYWYDTPTYR